MKMYKNIARSRLLCRISKMSTVLSHLLSMEKGVVSHSKENISNMPSKFLSMRCYDSDVYHLPLPILFRVYLLQFLNNQTHPFLIRSSVFKLSARPRMKTYEIVGSTYPTSSSLLNDVSSFCLILFLLPL